ncbi:fumarylacetoacetate hydrolase family protein [Burkholderia pseudomultivorans]|uniref:fumarylacetoacetate hydrolase family protein n=1 Tax=Burkholderia pseudomultivorans TaxID=1207504 RepID=UPI0007571941|nr:fumarylacetoacetate hydrolase family protein [Burkholderia pseudomultivorans]KVG62527.1 2-hydroxyhepta-2,4-diene-1,7-dioate isomerase [Burkholderia pseudomultivorans]
MFLCRFNRNRLGVVEDGLVHDVTAALDVLPSERWPQSLGDALYWNWDLVRDAIHELRPFAAAVRADSVTWAPPVATPSKIVCAPVNYLDHKREADADPANFYQHLNKIQEAGLFLKSTSALVGPSEGVRLRHLDRRNDHELELAVVIGRAADRVSRDDALSYVAGYAIGLDMTVRGPEERSFRKSVDTFAVLGPWLVTADELYDPSRLDIELKVNGELRQRANTRDLIVDVPGLIEMASSFYTLLPGDVILTGTPAGVGPVVPGDVIHASISRIGSMSVPIHAA